MGCASEMARKDERVVGFDGRLLHGAVEDVLRMPQHELVGGRVETDEGRRVLPGALDQMAAQSRNGPFRLTDMTSTGMPDGLPPR